jgi:hypothetical protein
MPKHFAARTRAIALATAIAGLAGCGAAEQAREKVGEAVSAGMGSFETATRSKIKDASDGRSYLLRVEARRKAHWYEAWAAMSRDLGSYCPDGVPFAVTRMTPEHNPAATPLGEYTWYPAGTVFEQAITCSNPFAAERMLAADVEPAQAMEMLKAELVGDDGFDPNRHMITMTTFNDRVPKYKAVAETVGGMVLGVNRRCRDAGATVQRIVLHSKPTPDPAQDVFLNSTEVFLGVDAVCADGLPADPRHF